MVSLSFSLSLSLSLSLNVFNGHFYVDLLVSRYQNISILDFNGAKCDGPGGNKWSYKMCKAGVKMSPSVHHTPSFYRLDALPVAQPTVVSADNILNQSETKINK